MGVLVATGRQDGTDEFIVGFVLCNRLPNPGVEGKSAVDTVGLAPALDSQDVGPAVGEQVTVLWRLQQGVHELVPLVRALVLDERLHLSRGWQCPRDVERRAANELLIGAKL